GGSGTYAPTPEGKNYEFLMALAPGTRHLRSAFDALSFDPSKALNASLALEFVTVQAIDMLGNERSEKRYVFANNANGFTETGDVEGFTTPAYGVGSRGLVIGAQDKAAAPTQTVFGAWTLNSDVRIAEG